MWEITTKMETIKKIKNAVNEKHASRDEDSL